ncbi:hypothetical protein TNCV_3837621 [Trichonephila clavipes]|nr:hypothetical protein TNCV_3837621 [Trichonephila clavipes]
MKIYTVQSVFSELFQIYFLWFRIIEEYHSEEFSAKRGRHSADHLPSRLSGRHFAHSIPPTEKKTSLTRQYVTCCSKSDSKGKKHMNYEVHLQLTLLYHLLTVGEDSLPDSKLILDENGRGISGFRLTLYKRSDDSYLRDEQQLLYLTLV